MALTIIIRHIEAKIAIKCPAIHEGGCIEPVSIPEPFARMYFTCLSDDGHTTKEDSVSVRPYSNASELIQSAINIAVSHFGGSPDDVRVMNGHYDVIPVERVMIDLPDERQKKGVAVEERFLPMREARATLLGFDGVIEAVKAYSAK